MKNKIQNILNIKKELFNCDNMIFEKENDILSCVKSVGEEGIRMRQKEAALSLLELKNKKQELEGQLNELCKGLDSYSFEKRKLSSEIISECIGTGISSSDLKELKEVFKAL